MPTKRYDIATDYRLHIELWEGQKWSEAFWVDIETPAGCTVNAINCYLRCTKGWSSVFPVVEDWKTCVERVDTNNKFEFNGYKVWEKPAHLDKALVGDGKTYLVKGRNSVRFCMYKSKPFLLKGLDGVFDCWLEIDYTGEEPTVTTAPATTYSPTMIEATENPALGELSLPFLGEFSTIFLLVVVVMIFVLIISAVRR